MGFLQLEKADTNVGFVKAKWRKAMISPFVVLAGTKQGNTREVLFGISSLEGEERIPIGT